MQVRKLVRAEQPLMNLSRTPYSLGLSYKIGVVRGLVEPLLEVFHEKRMDLVRKLGEVVRDDKGDPVAPAQWNVPPSKVEEFNRQFKPLLDEESEFEVPFTIKLSRLQQDARDQVGTLKLDPNQFVLTGADLSALDWLIENDLE